MLLTAFETIKEAMDDHSMDEYEDDYDLPERQEGPYFIHGRRESDAAAGGVTAQSFQQRPWPVPVDPYLKNPTSESRIEPLLLNNRQTQTLSEGEDQTDDDVDYDQDDGDDG